MEDRLQIQQREQKFLIKIIIIINSDNNPIIILLFYPKNNKKNYFLFSFFQSITKKCFIFLYISINSIKFTHGSKQNSNIKNIA